MRTPWLLILCACLTISGSVQGASDNPKRGGTLTIAIGRDIGLMHPLIGTTGNEQKTRELMFESLLAVDASGKVQPNLAESWEISDKGRLYAFNLRRGVRFHNGQEMTAEDVKYAVDYSLNPKNSAYGLNYLGLVERVELAGKYAIRFHLKKPSPLFLAALSDIQAFSVVPKGSLPEGVTKISQFPPGTGPFKFVDWQSGQRIVFERYEDYWGHKAFVDRLILRPIADENIRFVYLQSGDIDMIEWTPYEGVKQISEGKIRGIHAVKASYASMRRLVFNVASPPFNNKKMRQAVALAIDKKELIDAAYFGFGEPVDQRYPVGHFWYIDGVSAPARDLAKARALLKEAGYQGETIVVSTYPGIYEPVAITLQAQLKKVGINIKIEMMDSPAVISQQRRGDFTLGLGGGSIRTDPSEAYGESIRCEPDLKKRRGNRSGYCDKETENLLDQAETELDPTKRKAIFRQLLSKYFEEVPEIYVGYGPRFFSLRDYVRGFNVSGDDRYRWWGGGFNYI